MQITRKCVVTYLYIYRTDAFIQTKIKEKFKYCTIITIAHRLNTIIDSDKIMVMAAGKIVEADHAYKLLQLKNGYFSYMVEQTGPAMRQQLKDMAREAYELKICK